MSKKKRKQSRKGNAEKNCMNKQGSNFQRRDSNPRSSGDKNQTTPPTDATSGKEVANKPEGSKSDNDKGSGVPWKNDYKFYAINEQIAKDLASLPFNNIPGVGKNRNIKVLGGTIGNQKTYQGSIGRIAYDCVPGECTTITDGPNMAARQLYTFIRHANSGARNYEAPDAMMYVLAMRDIYATYAECKRALGIAYCLQYENRNLPKRILEAMNLDYDDLISNFAQYRGRLNLIAARINSLAVPSYFKMFDRTAYIASKVFGDSDSIRGQYYVFTREGYYTWNGSTSDKGTALLYNRFDDAYDGTLGSYLDILEQQLQAMLTDEDAAIISGDILKAFGEDKLYTLVPTPDDYIVMPVFDEDILAQIENARFIETYGRVKDTGDLTNNTMNITQSNQLIHFSPQMATPTTAAYPVVVTGNVLFNSHKLAPQYSDVLEWTRLMSMGYEDQGAIKITCGIELVRHMRLYVGENSGSIMIFNQMMQKSTGSGSSAITTFYLTKPEGLAMLGQFDWHPNVELFTACQAAAGQPFDVSYRGESMDIKFSTYVSVNEIKPMHDSASLATVWADGLYNKTSSPSKTD